MAESEMEYRTLTKRQSYAIPIMLGARSIEEGCRNARISRQTFYRWLMQPVFRLEYERVGRQLTDSALTHFKVSAVEAMEVVRALCIEARSESVRLRAAALMLRHVSELIEKQDEKERNHLLYVKAAVHAALQLNDEEKECDTEESISYLPNGRKVVFRWNKKDKGQVKED